MVRYAWTPVSEHDQLEVRDELERILASPPFRHSRRYPALLRYVVEKTLSGEVEDLKERILGVEVFHRAPDSDSNTDPVVSFRDGEVRRRLAQYYKAKATQTFIEIGLPIGAYIPQFSRADSPEDHLRDPNGNGAFPDGDFEPVAHERFGVSADTLPPKEALVPAQFFSRRSFFYGALVGVTAIAILALAGYFLVSKVVLRPISTPMTELWGPLLTSPDAVLISVGRTHVDDSEQPEHPNATIEQHILRPDARISLACVQAVSQTAGFLRSQHKQFMIHEAYSNTLQDLHRRPVVLISGYNNLWTFRLLKPLRFHFEQAGSLHYIVDSQRPDRRDWNVDFNLPYLQETIDYAIIGRFYDPSTDGFVVVVAGIGSNGSQAAGEFIVSPDALRTLAHSAPRGSLDQNFEAVLKVEVIGGNTGAATVVASQFW